MNVILYPSRLHGTIEAVASKSYAHRILIAAALCPAGTVTNIRINALSEDINASLCAIKCLGAEITQNDDIFTVRSGRCVTPVIECYESGTTSRLMLPISAALYDNGRLTGKGSLLMRPFGILCDVMREHGTYCDSRRLPINFHGRLMNGEFKISGAESSQYISALMMALPLLSGRSKITLTSPLQSSGYVDMTIDVMKRFGVTGGYDIKPQIYISPKFIEVEGDWSNAAFFIAAGVRVTNCRDDSAQKDKIFADVMKESEIDVSDIPDLVPILSVCALKKCGVTYLYNASRLKIKESNRLLSVGEMITKLGGVAEITSDSIKITGCGELSGGIVNSYNDHRIVMSAAIASSFCTAPVTITGAEAVNKSYPNFFRDFNRLGGKAHVQHDWK